MWQKITEKSIKCIILIFEVLSTNISLWRLIWKLCSVFYKTGSICSKWCMKHCWSLAYKVQDCAILIIISIIALIGWSSLTHSLTIHSYYASLLNELLVCILCPLRSDANFCRSANTGMSMWRSKQKNLTNEFILASQIARCISYLS